MDFQTRNQSLNKSNTQHAAQQRVLPVWFAMSPERRLLVMNQKGLNAVGLVLENFVNPKLEKKRNANGAGKPLLDTSMQTHFHAQNSQAELPQQLGRLVPWHTGQLSPGGIQNWARSHQHVFRFFFLENTLTETVAEIKEEAPLVSNSKTAKSWFKAQHLSSSHFRANRRGNNGKWQPYAQHQQNHRTYGDRSQKLKDTALEEELWPTL